MDQVERVLEYVKSLGSTEVHICGMNWDKNLLFGVDGRTYYEVHPNMWADRDSQDHDKVFLGTAKHGSWIVLRLLFVKVDGVWRNASNGRLAPDNIDLSRHSAHAQRFL